MDETDARQWFGDYLDTFAACARGEKNDSEMLAFYAVPLLLTTDSGVVALVTPDAVDAASQQQIDGVRAAGYDHSEVLDWQFTTLNATSALVRGTFSRRRADGAEIAKLTATYLLTEGEDGRRLSALVLHSSAG